MYNILYAQGFKIISKTFKINRLLVLSQWYNLGELLYQLSSPSKVYLTMTMLNIYIFYLVNAGDTKVASNRL